MTPEMWITLAILVAAIVLFITEKLRVDVVALGVVISLMLTGVLSTGEALAGFSNSAVLTIASPHPLQNNLQRLGRGKG